MTVWRQAIRPVSDRCRKTQLCLRSKQCPRVHREKPYGRLQRSAVHCGRAEPIDQPLRPRVRKSALGIDGRHSLRVVPVSHDAVCQPIQCRLLIVGQTDLVCAEIHPKILESRGSRNRHYVFAAPEHPRQGDLRRPAGSSLCDNLDFVDKGDIRLIRIPLEARCRRTVVALDE